MVSKRYHAGMDELPQALLALIGSLARLAQGELRERALSAELQPVHLVALGYLRDANRYSNTPQALAEYLGSTKGTVSQSLLLLYRKGLVERYADEHDGRVVRLRLSAAGRRLLRAGDFDVHWAAAVANLPAADAARVERALADLLRTLQRRRGGRSFGVCASCAHFQRRGDAAFRCGLTGEPLGRADSAKICREHAVTTTAA